MFSVSKKLLLFAFLSPVLVFAYQNPGTPSGFVNDFAGLLNVEQKAVLEAKLTAFENNTRNEIAVVTVKNLGEDSVENYAEELFKEWGIGKKGADNGVLVLVAAHDRKMRIEVGYGLEGALTDAQASWIIRNIMTPAFRANEFYGGIDGAVSKIIAAVGGERVPSETVNEDGISSKGSFFDVFAVLLLFPLWLGSILGRSKSWWLGGVIGGIIGVVVGLAYGFFYSGAVALAVLIPLGLLFDFVVSRAYGKSTASGRRPPWWIGGGRVGGGGFGGFGGGSSGGGGASGSW